MRDNACLEAGRPAAIQLDTGTVNPLFRKQGLEPPSSFVVTDGSEETCGCPQSSEVPSYICGASWHKALAQEIHHLHRGLR